MQEGAAAGTKAVPPSDGHEGHKYSEMLVLDVQIVSMLYDIHVFIVYDI